MRLDRVHPDRTIRAFLVGPTGVGKTDVALALASSLGAEIVSIDSRQLYRGLDVGTAKPTAAQRRAVRHHLIDLLDPRERCSAGRFVQFLRTAVQDLASRGVAGLAVGGAGLYVDAAMGRLHPLPPADEELRERLAEIARVEGRESLHRRLAEVDPITAARLAPRDLQRIIRALEVAAHGEGMLSERIRGETEPVVAPDTPVFYLTRNRRELYARIEARCAAMVEAGLPEEVRGLLAGGVPRDAPGLKSVGYAEWSAWALGEQDRASAMELFVRNSRRYAKRQETWFRNRHPQRVEIVIADDEAPAATAARIAALLVR